MFIVNDNNPQDAPYEGNIRTQGVPICTEWCSCQALKEILWGRVVRLTTLRFIYHEHTEMHPVVLFYFFPYRYIKDSSK